MEKFFYENVLTLTKSLATLYLTGATECANESVRKVLVAGLDEILVLQDDIYQTMSEDGYYDVKNIDKDQICMVYDKLKEDY